MVIAYIMFSEDGPEAIVKAHRITPSKMFKGRIELTGVEGVTELQHPQFKVQKLVILEERLVTIMEGFEENEDQTEDEPKPIQSSNIDPEAISTETKTQASKTRKRGRPRKNKGNENGEK